MRLPALGLLANLTVLAIAQDAPKVLIFGWAGSKEHAAAVELGYNTTVVTETAWANMTTLDFAHYDAIIVPDLNTDYISSLKFLEDSKDQWSPATTGRMIVVGGDPVNHISTGGATTLISNAVRFVTAGGLSQGTTGLYLTLSRCYDAVDSATVEVLTYFGNFTIRGNLNCYDKVHLVASSDALGSLDDDSLSNWGCSVHEAFSSYPSIGLDGFQALAIAQDVLGEGSQRFGDGSVGLPYILSRGATPAACGDGLWNEIYGEECDDGNTDDGDGCSSSCKCESGLPNGDGTCFNPPTSSGYLAPPSSYLTESYGPPSSYGNHSVATATTSSGGYTTYILPTSYSSSNKYTTHKPPPYGISPCHSGEAYVRPTHPVLEHEVVGHAHLEPRYKSVNERTGEDRTFITAEAQGAAIRQMGLSTGLLVLGLLVCAVSLYASACILQWL